MASLVQTCECHSLGPVGGFPLHELLLLLQMSAWPRSAPVCIASETAGSGQELTGIKSGWDADHCTDWTNYKVAACSGPR